MNQQQAKHTEGPWTVDHLHGEPLVVNEETLGDICRMSVISMHKSDAEANARLIAAAPEMLSALRKAVLALAHVCESSSDDANFYGDAYSAVSAAIAKATV